MKNIYFVDSQAATVIAKRINASSLGDDDLDGLLTLGSSLMQHHRDHCKHGVMVDFPEHIEYLESWFEAAIDERGIDSIYYEYGRVFGRVRYACPIIRGRCPLSVRTTIIDKWTRIFLLLLKLMLFQRSNDMYFEPHTTHFVHNFLRRVLRPVPGGRGRET